MNQSNSQEAARQAREAAEQREQQKKLQILEITGGLTPQQHADRLGTLRAKLIEPNAFKVGDLITPKDGLSDFNVPQPGYPVIVHEILDPPLVDLKIESITDTRFRRVYDMVVLVWRNSQQGGTAIPFHIQSERFEPWNPEKQA